MAQSPDEMTSSMIANMEAKTGKSLAQWMKIAQSCKLAKHGEVVKMLKSEHGVTHGYANLIAHLARQEADGGASSDTELVEQQYAGPKADLKPIYDAILEAVGKFGKDIEVAPKKGYVSLRRAKQFAIIQPSTRTRLDIGINLKGVEAEGRLEESGSFNAMVSHRVRVESMSSVDKDLISWLRRAYEAAK